MSGLKQQVFANLPKTPAGEIDFLFELTRDHDDEGNEITPILTVEETIELLNTPMEKNGP